jgi:hypothetical protein
MEDEAVIGLIIFSIQLITTFYVVVDIWKDHKKSDLDKFIEMSKKKTNNL